jgi:Trk K+ transport system NAD-binding subunit/Kef-type K+ transport system membrane component KefB
LNQLIAGTLALATFAIVVLASELIGRFLTKLKLPMISGFLLVGILVGPYVLHVISSEVVERVSFLNSVSLGVIAFAAGSELHLTELRSRIKSISYVTISNSVIIPLIGTIATLYLADLIPFMQPLTPTGRLAVALLIGAILVARSPSSAIAVVNEVRARGPFTQTVLGVTMLSDVVIIVLFAIAASTAHALLNSRGLQLGFVFLLAVELLLSLAVGYALGKLLHLILSLRIHNGIKASLVVLVGYLIFFLSTLVRQTTHQYLPFELAIEPLLICMIGGFVVTNYSAYRAEFLQILHDVGPPIYVIFFTLTGVGLRLDLFVDVWAIALLLFVIRLVAIFIASYTGGTLAGDPAQHNLLSWMGYVTQAGVALGLSMEVGAEFSGWGEAFATMMISSIVVSQLVGPPLFKWVIQRVGEAHMRGPSHEFDGKRDAIIFGLEGQSLALARLLTTSGWKVKIASRQLSQDDLPASGDVTVHHISALTVEAMQELDLEHADVVVGMLSNDENFRLCEIAFEHFGISRLVVRLTEHEESDRFAQLGAIVFEPTTAMIRLLDHFVRVPAATSLLLEQNADQRVADIQISNPNLDGLTIRDLRLPLDVLILSVRRNGSSILSHGYTQLERGDWVSMVGSPEGLEQVALHLEA